MFLLAVINTLALIIFINLSKNVLIIFIAIFYNVSLYFLFGVRIKKAVYSRLIYMEKTISNQKGQINAKSLEILDNKNTISAITENMQEGLLILDNNGVILSVNKSASNLFHTKSRNYEGRNILEFTRNVSLSMGIKKAMLGRNNDFTIEVNDKTIQVFVNPVFNNSEVTGIIALFLDITEKTNTDKMRREFSANVSHELKTPLTTISGYAEMISNDMVKDSDIKNIATKIGDESERLLNLIEDIIKLSQLDEGLIKENFKSFDIKTLAEDIVKRLEFSALEKNITISLSCDKHIISANFNMISDLLFNLIDNAIKYNRDYGNVNISIENLENKTKIIVSDTGIGIEKDELNRVFERFYRVDKSRSQKIKGTGLGLSIVKHVVEYHNGTINIESEPNAQTKIIVIF